MNKITMEKIVSLCKRRGFVYPGSEIYGGLANSWDFGPLGVELKNNIKNLWWKKFVLERDDVVGIDAALIMNTKVWEASGHLKEFSDPLVECRKCHKRFREEDVKSKCLDCGGELTDSRKFNLMFKTFLGPTEDENSVVYLRPETAQAMFVNFKNVANTERKTLPFGIAQIGKAFRNEITPGNFIFRTREFEQMEIEYFFEPPANGKEWQNYFNHWQNQMMDWITEVGIDVKNIKLVDIPDGERAHYSKKTIDFEYEFPFGQKELYGLVYRADFDLKNHFKDAPYKEQGSKKGFWPHVIEPTWGVERTVLAVLLDAYCEENERAVLKLNPKLAPYKAAVFPLLSNKPKLSELARNVYKNIKTETGWPIDWDDRGNIGKRYFSQDEIGTPYCITVDFDSLENDDVTVRDRDTMEQERIKISKLGECLRDRLS